MCQHELIGGRIPTIRDRFRGLLKRTPETDRKFLLLIAGKI